MNIEIIHILSMAWLWWFSTPQKSMSYFSQKKIASILKELCNEKTDPKLGMDMNIENESIYGFGVSPNFSCGGKHCVC